MPERVESSLRDPRLAPGVARPDALGQSEAFLSFQEQLSRVAKVDRPVLVVGERGTGKELAVARLHFLSNRWQGPLVALNCAALSPTVIESELFGHEAGAFTGANRRREGRFETADAGTLFLDEIGLIPLQVQEKILRVVEYGEFERVGASEPTQVDARIVGATNADLAGLAIQNRFKADLLDRLSFEVLFLPPLRERREDIMLLARHFAGRMAIELDREIPKFTAEAVRELNRHPWPGNIRELKNVVERAVYKCEGGRIDTIVFDPFARNRGETGNIDAPAAGAGGQDLAMTILLDGESLPGVMRRIEMAALRRALAQCQYRQREAAARLGLTYHQFRGLYRKYESELKAPSDFTPPASEGNS